MKSLLNLLVQLYYDKIYHNEVINDPNYIYSKVDEGMKTRLKESDSVEIIERITRSYNKAKVEQNEMSSVYQVNNEWIPIYDKYLKEIIEALHNNEFTKVKSMFDNFMRDDCSVGLHGLSFTMKKDFFSGEIKNFHKRQFLRDFLHRKNLWHLYNGNDCTLSELYSPLIGNPYGLTIDKQFIRAGSFYSHHYARQISRILQRKDSKRKTVLEIGAGYGAMAYYLCRDKDDLSYVSIDLPENMALTAYYLIRSFPDKKIYIHGESEISGNIIEENDIFILSNTDIERLPDTFFDLVFNSYSLAEMSKETINHYITNINRLCKNYFLHVNHNKNANVVADNFGVDINIFTLVYKTQALWNYGRNINMDEFEYLYKKLV